MEVESQEFLVSHLIDDQQQELTRKMKNTKDNFCFRNTQTLPP